MIASEGEIADECQRWSVGLAIPRHLNDSHPALRVDSHCMVVADLLGDPHHTSDFSLAEPKRLAVPSQGADDSDLVFVDLVHGRLSKCKADERFPTT
jgi:hypothetical protein